MRFAQVLAFALGAAFSANAAEVGAAEITSVELTKGSHAILVVGDIVSGDQEKFKDEAGKYDHAVVLLESEGGSTITAISIGEAIRLKGYSTAVINGSDCNSACALIWLAGSPRAISKSGRVGFHATYTEKAGRQSESGVGNAIVGRYLTLLNLPEKALIFATSAAPSDLNYLNASNHEETGIDTKIIDDIHIGPDATSDAPPPLVAQADQPMPGYWKSGNELYSDCTTREADSSYYMMAATCRAFIQGIDDGVGLTRWALKIKRLYCTPRGATAAQIRDVVVKELRDNPAQRNLPAAALAVSALQKAFPC
jgi:hypothetical protein